MFQPQFRGKLLVFRGVLYTCCLWMFTMAFVKALQPKGKGTTAFGTVGSIKGYPWLPIASVVVPTCVNRVHSHDCSVYLHTGIHTNVCTTRTKHTGCEVLRKGIGNSKGWQAAKMCWIRSQADENRMLHFTSAAGQDEEMDLCCKDHNLQQLGFSGLLELKYLFSKKVLTVHSSTSFFVSDRQGGQKDMED